METAVLITVLAANLITTIVGFTVLINKIQDASRWKGWADTKIKANCGRITRHGERIDDIGERLARHEGAG